MTTEQTLKRELRIAQESLERKNRELDALHYVWCDGGCDGGVHRYGDHAPLTEELVQRAERQVRRMRDWLTNHDHRSSNAGNQRAAAHRADDPLD